MRLSDKKPMTLTWMRQDMREEYLPAERTVSEDLNASEDTYNVVENTYKDMEDFEERID